MSLRSTLSRKIKFSVSIIVRLLDKSFVFHFFGEEHTYCWSYLYGDYFLKCTVY